MHYGWVQHETLWGNNTIPFCWIYHFLIQSVQQKTTDKQLLERVIIHQPHVLQVQACWKEAPMSLSLTAQQLTTTILFNL